MGNDKNNGFAKPFLKWAGGKGQLLKMFVDFYPRQLINGEIDYYYEPFLGGGAVFFDLTRKVDFKRAYLYDSNKDLVLAYRVIQKYPDELIEVLTQIDNEYKRRGKIERTELFYSIRNKFNEQLNSINYKRVSKKWVIRAAWLIFLNHTCFNGLFRFNSKGKFNVPEGSYKNPKIVDAVNIKNVSKALERAVIKRCDFREFVKDVKYNSFIYYDPPYRPISKTAKFTAYGEKIFDDNDQKELAGLFDSLNKKKVYQMLSNSDPKNVNSDDDFFDELYEKYNINRVKARRNINSVPDRRKNIKEIIVTNYDIEG